MDNERNCVDCTRPLHPLEDNRSGRCDCCEKAYIEERSDLPFYSYPQDDIQ